MKAPIRLFAVVSAVALGIAEPACSSQVPHDASGTLVTTLGSDTVVMESYTRTAKLLEGKILVRVPGTVLLHYTVDLDGNGAARHSVVDIMPLGTKEVGARRVTIDFASDSASVDFDSSGHHTRSRVAAKSPAMPQLMTGFGSSYGLYDSPVFYTLYPAVAAASSGDTVRVATFDVASGRRGHRMFLKRSPTKLEADYFGMVWNHVMLDGSGGIESVDAQQTTERTLTSRAAPADIAAIAQIFAARDKAGKGLGAASPSEIERGTVGGKQVVISYSSPRRRGRDVLGKVVPYGDVWRTGANEATTIFSDSRLDIGGTTIPPGVFTLWTLPKSDGTVDLIVNKQHGQWGTDYDGKQDVARIPMRVTKASVPADDFVIKLTDGTPGALTISWDRFVWSVPISLAK